MKEEQKHLANHFSKAALESNSPDRNISNKALDEMVLVIVGFLFLSGAEALKVYFRKNFGKKGINIPYLWVISFVFCGVAIFELFHPMYEKVIIDRLSAILIASNGILILFRGYQRKREARIHSDYEGDTFAENTKKGNRNGAIYTTEPLIFAAIGITWSIVFYFVAGLPNLYVSSIFIFCAISVYFSWFLKTILNGGSSKKQSIIENNNDPNFLDNPNKVIIPDD